MMTEPVLSLPVERPRKSLRVALLGVFVLGAVATLLSALEDQSLLLLVQVVVLILMSLNVAWRWRDARADAFGIRRLSTIRPTPWSQVQALIEPGRWDPTVHLRTTSGTNLPTGVLSEHFDALVELSGKPIEPRPAPHTAGPKTPPQR